MEQANDLPTLNVNVGLPTTENKENEIVKPDQLISYYTEIFDNIREDRKEVDDVLKNFIEMVINEGESTQASKEALVNLLKIKSEIADKKTRVLDLLLRVFMKERDTFPRYLAASQTNNFDGSSTRKLLKKFKEKLGEDPRQGKANDDKP